MSALDEAKGTQRYTHSILLNERNVEEDEQTFLGTFEDILIYHCGKVRSAQVKAEISKSTHSLRENYAQHKDKENASGCEPSVEDMRSSSIQLLTIHPSPLIVEVFDRF